jgi:RNA polymerase sigma-70 factor (ECF subfamily)
VTVVATGKKSTSAALSDSQLILLYLKEQDAKYFSQLYRRYAGKVFAKCISMLGDHGLARDATQDVFIKIIDTLQNKRYTEEGKFLPWALRIARNLCLDYFRKVKRTPTIKTSDSSDIFEVIHLSEDAPDTKLMQGQSHERVRRMLDLLPEEQREIIVLRHYANLSFKEIAQITDCSINTALGRMRYGLINLRKLMIEKQIAL